MHTSAKFVLGVVVCALFALPSFETEAVPRSPAGRWLVETIRGEGVLGRPRIILDLAEDGTVTGSGGCNRMTGKAKLDGKAIEFGAIAATRMACLPAVMDQEWKFFDALSSARAWRADNARNKLMLLDRSGKIMVVLARR